MAGKVARDHEQRLHHKLFTAPLNWMRENLFNSLFNTILTLTTAAILLFLGRAVLSWAFSEANWAVIPANFRLLMVGPYPSGEMWRIWTGVVALSLAVGFQWGKTRHARPFVLLSLAAIAIIIFLSQAGTHIGLFAPTALVALLIGFSVSWLLRPSSWVLTTTWTVIFFAFVYLLGANFGQGGVNSNLWGGLLLTLLISIVAIVGSFPLGVFLAIGRTSQLPVVSLLATIYIELIRGVPLLVVLFLAQLFVPLLMPDFEVPKILRAMIGITLFQAAYIAENVRGGLQAISIGQTEAARALGLTNPQALWLIVLPQALRAVIPANVGQFIQLFKETSLVSIVGLTDLLGIGNVIVANPNWLGLYKEVYLTIAMIYAVFSYAMASASYALEKRLENAD